VSDLEARPAGERWCRCVKTHNPGQLPNEAEGHHVWPLGMGGPDVAANMRWLCPTTHTKVHNLWRAYAQAGGRPDWEVLRRYSGYVRELVADGWAQVMLAGKVEHVRRLALSP
jgi:hypothetical protein